MHRKAAAFFAALGVSFYLTIVPFTAAPGLLNELTAPKNPPLDNQSLTVTLTAYSSTPDQTDDTPFITASGALVEDGVVAANFLPFGTRIKIPALFGDKIFIVKDRMHQRFSNRLDIWFPDRKTALKFGIQETEIVILT